MKAIVYQGPNQIALKDVNKPEPKDGYTLIKVAYAGICGGDLNIYFGTHPRAKAPLIMGHEFSGTIESGHPSLPAGTPVTINPGVGCGHCEPCQEGNKHVCKTLRIIGIDRDGTFAEYAHVLNEKVVPLPAGMDLKSGALIEPVAVAVHSVRELGYRTGDTCAVFGCGTIGLCTAMVLRVFGASDLVVIETNPKRLELAKSLGFDTINPMETDVSEAINVRTNGAGMDVVYDCAGHQSVMDVLPDVVKIRGSLVIVAGYKKAPTFSMIKGMFKEFSIYFVRMYRDRDYDIAVNLVNANPDYAKLITHVLEPEAYQEGFDLMLDPASDALKVLYAF